MTYRIRYRMVAGAAEGEMLVEANSPTEALVKFRCAHGPGRSGAGGQDMVTSVCAANEAGHVDDQAECASW